MVQRRAAIRVNGSNCGGIRAQQSVHKLNRSIPFSRDVKRHAPRRSPHSRRGYALTSQQSGDNVKRSVKAQGMMQRSEATRISDGNSSGIRAQEGIYSLARSIIFNCNVKRRVPRRSPHTRRG